MKTSTLTALKAILDGDPVRTRQDRETLMRTLGLEEVAVSKEPEDKLVSFEEAAKRLNRSPRSLHLLARRGVLRKAILPGFKRASGVMASDLDRLLAGMANGADLRKKGGTATE